MQGVKLRLQTGPIPCQPNSQAASLLTAASQYMHIYSRALLSAQAALLDAAKGGHLGCDGHLIQTNLREEEEEDGP